MDQLSPEFVKKVHKLLSPALLHDIVLDFRLLTSIFL